MILASFLLGIATGMRSILPLAAAAWLVHSGRLPVESAWLRWIGSLPARILLTILAGGELVTDKMPTTPSRLMPVQFGARLFSAGACGLVVGLGSGGLVATIAVALLGSFLGTLGGSRYRSFLARALKHDTPAALIEDLTAIALVAAAWLVAA